MADSSTITKSIQRRIQGAHYALRRAYRVSPVRNFLIARKAPKPAEHFAGDCQRFAIFLVPGWDFVSGGIMSIFSIAAETRNLLAGNGVSVAVCTAVGEPRMLRFTQFENQLPLFAFSDMLEWMPQNSEVIVHIPEVFLQSFASARLDVYRLRSDIKWQFNILLQNIETIPPRSAVAALQQVGVTTATLAHKASMAIAESLGCPVHFLSWFISAEDFRRVPFAEKQKLVVVSPDRHPAKAEIVRRMTEALPDHKFIEIRRMTYQQYKKTIGDAKFMFTFGEGLDGYFVESIFSGAIAMAIFDQRFFTPEYGGAPGVFADTGAATSGVAEFVRSLSDEARFRAIAERQYELVSKTFAKRIYQDNIKSFYSKYVPTWLTAPSPSP